MSEKNQKKETQKIQKKPYEKPRIILEEKIEGRAGVCGSPPGKGPGHIPPCSFLNS